ncbi:MAG TPA: hypothetical protein VKU40_07990 [Thermoanaerobaculia bacterium]|nr:hypothetical protein [Thermoanaerobaculia bacterium]
MSGRLRGLALVAAAGLLAAPVMAQPPSHTPSHTPSPYAGEEGRDIKALSTAEVDGLLAGAGMGYAKAAELNRHPGPKHVLELADELRLSPEQRTATEAAFERMAAAAKDLGSRLVAAERDLDRAFAAGGLDADELRRRTAAIADLEGELRYVHLAAHLEMRALLDERQVAHYEWLRGYGDGGGHGGEHHHGHGGHGEGHGGH